MVDDLRAAFWWALENVSEIAVELVGGLGAWIDRSMIVEMSGWADRLLQHYADVGTAPTLSRVLVIAAAGARFPEDLERADALATRAVEEAHSDDMARAVAHYLLAEVAMFRRDIGRLLHHQREVEALAAREPGLAATSGMVALLAIQAVGYAGDETAVESAHQLQRRAERHDWPMTALWVQLVRAELARRAEQESAGPLLADTLRRARALGDGQLITAALVPAAEWESAHGNPDTADTLFAELLQHWRQLGDPRQRFFALRLVVEHLARNGRDNEAVTLATAILHPRRAEQGWNFDVARAEQVIAALDHAVGAQPLQEGGHSSRTHRRRLESSRLPVPAGDPPRAEAW